MLVDGMNYAQIIKEVSKDIKNIETLLSKTKRGEKLKKYFNKNKRVIKLGIIPSSVVISYKSKDTLINYKITCIFDESQWLMFRYSFAAVKDSSYGFKLLMLSSHSAGEPMSITEYSPHVLDRFKERYLEKDSVYESYDKVLDKFCNASRMGAYIIHEDTKEVELAIREGILLGRVVEPRYYKINTFISEDMLSSSQRHYYNCYISTLDKFELDLRKDNRLLKN